MFLEPSEKLNHTILFQHFDDIKNDYFTFKQNNLFQDYISIDDCINNPKNTGYYWQVCPIFFMGNIFPNSSQLIRKSKILDCITRFTILPTIATFSILAPNSKIDTHKDHDDNRAIDTKNILADLRTTSMVKYHLAIEIPTDNVSTITVSEETRTLKVKDLNIFDETSPHGVNNYSLTMPRGVLICSWLRSDLYE